MGSFVLAFFTPVFITGCARAIPKIPMVSHTVMARLVNLTGKGVGEEFFGMLITWNSAGHHAALVVGPSTPANVMKSVIGTG